MPLKDNGAYATEKFRRQSMSAGLAVPLLEETAEVEEEDDDDDDEEENKEPPTRNQLLMR